MNIDLDSFVYIVDGHSPTPDAVREALVNEDARCTLREFIGVNPDTPAAALFALAACGHMTVGGGAEAALSIFTEAKALEFASKTREDLVAEWIWWCSENGLPALSVDDMHLWLSVRLSFTNRFSARWDEAVRREDGR